MKNINHNQFEYFNEDPAQQYITSDKGVRVNDIDNSLKTCEPGSTIMKDFIFCKRMTHLDHRVYSGKSGACKGKGRNMQEPA